VVTSEFSGEVYAATDGENPDSTGQSGIFRGTLRATSIGILILITIIAFEAMAVAAALPTAAKDLHGLGAYGWAFTGFLIANVVGMVVAGQVSDSHGPRVPLAAGLVAFVTGLVLAGAAPWMAMLVAGRVVQGLGGGLLITASYVVIGESYPEALRPKLFAAISSAWIVPSLIGPLVSGVLAQHISWRWVFLGLVPFVLVGCALLVPTLRAMRSPEADPGSPLAAPLPPATPSLAGGPPGRVLHALAVAAGIAALEQAGQHPSALSIAAGVLGLAALLWGLRTLLPAGTVTIRPGPSAPIALRGLLAGAFFGVESIVPLSLTVQHGYGATAAGLPLAISGLAWSVGSYVQSRDPKGDEERHRIRLVRAGLSLIACAAVLVAIVVHPGVPGWLMYPSWCVAGFGAGLSMSTVSVLLLKYTNDEDRGTDSAALQLSDATVSAFTTGIGGVLVAAAARASIGYTTAFTVIALAMAVVAACGAAVSGRVRAPR
jgi:MFS family permease